MTLHQKIFALIIAVSFLLFILELVRKRKIKEEYSWLWLLVAFLMIVLVVWYDLLLLVTKLIGAIDPLTTLFLFGFLFLLFLNISYSIRISEYKDQIKKLAQKIGILSKKLDDFKNERK